MSRNTSGRSWYRLSSIVRPTPYSSRDPSPPRRALEAPPSPPSQPLSPMSPRSPPKEVREAKPSPVPSPRSIKHEPTLKPRQEHETTTQRISKSSDKTNVVHGPNKKQEEFPSPRSPPKEVKEAKPSPVPSPWFAKHEPTLKPRPEHETTTQHILKSPDKTNLVQGPHKKHQQQGEFLSPRSSPKEVKEAKLSPVPSPWFVKHETTTKTILKSSDKTNLVPGPSKKQHQDEFPSPRSPPKEVKEAKPSPVPSPKEPTAKPRHEHETTHHETLTSMEKTNLVLQEPNNKQEQNHSNLSSSELDDDFLIGTQGVIAISSENKGAIMEIVRKTSKGEEEKSTSKSKTKKHIKNGENLPMDSFVNSNVQIVNGSVVYNSVDTHHDPGVHLSLYRNYGNGFIIKDHGDGYTSSIN